ncbi:MAG: GNAT family N-acetyltransferase [Phycisphaerae bacterium]
MSLLSNLLGRRPQPPGGDDAPQVRQVLGEELEPALRLILGGTAGKCGDATLLDFLNYAVHRHIDLYEARALVAGGMVRWAALPIVSPGRTALLLCPGKTPADSLHQGARDVLEACCHNVALAGCQIAQVLLEPSASAVESLLNDAGFSSLTKLVYLKLQRTRAMPADLPAGLRLLPYAPERHAAFTEAIEQSYIASQDCPELNGKRTMEDVLASHRAAGAFDPERWRVLMEGDKPLGVSLCAALADGRSCELVYLGVSAAARGRRLGQVLLRSAIQDAYERDQTSMSLAVDARNVPALKLYWRHGFVRSHERVALLRDLRQTQSGSTPTSA